MPKFIVALAALIFAFCPHLIGQESIVKRCEAEKGPSRMAGNQPIPEQLNIPNAPKTVRRVSCFRSFKHDPTMVDIVRKCGIPDKHMGSGIYIFGYYMNDCSVVSVSTGDLQHVSITHVKNGRSTLLLK